LKENTLYLSLRILLSMNGILLCFPRVRFTVYSYELNSTFGFSFIVFVILWLRVHNVRERSMY
jgi:hypothetical protein